MTSCFIFNILYKIYFWTCRSRVSFMRINTICDSISPMVKHMLTPRKYKYDTHNYLSWTYDFNLCVSKTTNQIITQLTWVLGMYRDTIKEFMWLFFTWRMCKRSNNYLHQSKYCTSLNIHKICSQYNHTTFRVVPNYKILICHTT